MPNAPAKPIVPPPPPSRDNPAPTPGSARRPAPPPRQGPTEFAPFTPPGADAARRAGTVQPVKVQRNPNPSTPRDPRDAA